MVTHQKSLDSLDALAGSLGARDLGLLNSDSVQKKIERFSRLRDRSRLHLHYINHLLDTDKDFQLGGFASHRDRLRDCGLFITLHNYYVLGQIHVAKARFCKSHIICPLCAYLRASRATKAYWEKYQVIKSESPGLQPYLLTYTVKNGPDFLERFNHLRDSLKKLSDSRRQTVCRGSGGSQLAYFSGGVYSIEFTKSAHGWHPHIHYLVLGNPDNLPDFPIGSNSGDLKKQSLLSQEWARCSGDSFICDLRPITGIDGFCEVFKYALKYSSLEVPDTFHAWFNLRGNRLMGSFGCFRGVEVPEYIDYQLLDSPYVELNYKYHDFDGYHLQSYSIPAS
jgi:hypothetical protein